MRLAVRYLASVGIYKGLAFLAKLLASITAGIEKEKNKKRKMMEKILNFEDIFTSF